MRIKYYSVLNLLWLAVAVSMPLFAVEFFRFNNEILRIHIAIPMFTIGAIIIITVLFSFSGFRMSRIANGPLLALLCSAFLLWHLYELTTTEDLVLASREVYKLFLGLLCLWTIIFSFPRTKDFSLKFWTVTVWSSTALMIHLIFIYYFIFHSAFLSNNPYEATRYGRNQVTDFIIFVFPFAFARFFFSRYKLWAVLSPFILTIALVYAGSRAAALSCIISIFVLAIMTAQRRGIKKAAAYLSWAIVLTGIVVILLNAYVPNLEGIPRLLYLVKPNITVPGPYPRMNSYHERGSRIWGGVNLFLNSPIRGIGLGNSLYHLGTTTHNDYSQILGELGIVGFSLFIAILFVVARNLIHVKSPPATASSWMSTGMRMAFPAVLFSLNFINSYTTPLLWIFLGLCLVQADMDRIDLERLHHETVNP